MPIEQLSSPLEAARWLRARVRGALHVDSRRVRPGDGFIAWPGAATDGRAYVSAAMNQGAVACLVEHEGIAAFGFDSPAVASLPGLKAATGPVAAAYYEAPSQSLQVLAITGTNGKTSTAWWLAEALSNRELETPTPCALIGTLGIGVPGEMLDTGLTTPDPVRLQGALRELVERGFGACAMEASSIGISERRLDGLHIAVAVFTNFTQDHLDYHGSMEAYWQAKSELFRWPGVRAAVVNIDDLHGALLVKNLQDAGAVLPELWTLSARGAAARLSAHNVQYGAEGLQFSVLEQGRPPVHMSTALFGEYNVANLLGVIGALRALGHSLERAVAACRHISSVPGRMERVSPFDEPSAAAAPLVVVDFAHTPDALDKALAGLRTLAQERGGQLWCLFGCGGNRDAIKRPMMAAVAEARADRIVLTSDNPRHEAVDAILSQILCGLTRPAGAQVQPDRAIAIAQTIAAAAPSDVILLAGKGHEQYQEVAGQRLPFSDRAHAEAALRARGVQ